MRLGHLRKLNGLGKLGYSWHMMLLAIDIYVTCDNETYIHVVNDQ